MNKLKYILFVLIAVMFFSCEDDFNKPPVTTSQAGIAPVIEDVAADIQKVLLKKNEKDTVVSLKWSDATYADQIGVRYYIQIDTVGNDFAKPLEFKRVASTDFTMKVKELNTLISKRFAPVVEVELECRVRAFANVDLESLYTTAFTFKVTPYLDVVVPSELFMYGSALTVGDDVSKALKTFGKDDVFTKYLKLTKDGLFNFSDKQATDGNAYNFGTLATTSNNIEKADDEAGNFKFTGETGWYKVSADFVNSKLEISTYENGSVFVGDYTNIYFVGDYNTTDGAWSPGTSPELTRTSEGVYTIDVVLKDGAQFKFISQQDWDGLDWADASSDGNSSIVAPKGANNNIKFDGGDKTYVVTLDLNSGTYTVVEKIFALYIVGHAIADIGDAGNGWVINEALALSMIQPKVYSGIINMSKSRENTEFKFFQKKDWNTGVASSEITQFIGNVEAKADGNYVFNGAEAGKYIVLVDLNTNTVTVTKSIYLLGGDTSADGNSALSVASQTFGDSKHYVYSYITNSSWGYKFIPTQGGWDGDLGVSKTESGKLVQNDEDNLSVSEEGFYQLIVDFAEGTISALKTDWGVIGSATTDGWNSDQDMTFETLAGGEKKGSYTWSITTDLVVGEMKFRANNNWDPPHAANLGDTGADGSLEPGGDNIQITEAGNYTIKMILAPTGYTYTLTKN